MGVIFPLSLPGKIVLILVAMALWLIFSVLQWPRWWLKEKLKKHVIWLSIDIFTAILLIGALTVTGGTGWIWWVLLVIMLVFLFRRLVLVGRAVKDEEKT